MYKYVHHCNIIYLKRNYFNMTEMNDNPEMLLPLLILFFFSCTVRTQDEFGCSPVEGCRSNYPGVVRIVTKPWSWSLLSN